MLLIFCKLCVCLIAYRCHDSGATAILYAPQHQLLVTGGKRGLVSIFDVRQRKLMHTFAAHEHSAIKSMAIDPCEEYFVTGSAEGDIKVGVLCKVKLFVVCCIMLYCAVIGQTYA